MPATLPKADILKAIQEIPDGDVSIDDVIARLMVLHKVQTGLQQKGQGIPHEEVKAEFEKPYDQRKWR